MELTLPKTLDEAVDYFYDWFDGIEEIGEPEDKFAGYCQSQLSGGIGMHMRNHLGLWGPPSNELHRSMIKDYGLDNPDDISDLIIRSVHKAYRKNNGLVWTDLNNN